MKKLLSLSVALFLSLFLYSQADTTSDIVDLFDMSLEELMDIEASVITKKSVKIKDNPGIVTVITKDQIELSGAKDLRELLELYVPAFQFGVDVEGVVGIGVRGMWGNEGKVLLMIDGIECNEDMFATLAFGNHYFLDNIKKIEISRGPGSAIYGGYAGLSVVNIITKDADDKSYFSGSYSQMSKSFAQRLINTNLSKKTDNFSVSFNAAYSQGVRSQLDNIDFNLDTISLNGNSQINTAFFNLLIKYKGLTVRHIADLYSYNQIDLWGSNYRTSLLTEKFNSAFGDYYYDIKLKKHTITPQIQIKYQKPWCVDVPDEDYINTKYVTKFTAKIVDKWDITDNINLLTGIEFYKSSLNLPKDYKDYEETFKNGSNSFQWQNFSAYTQLLYFNPVVNVTLGGRYDNSTEFGQSFVPRVALTKSLEHFYAKAMVSQSFRVPGGIITNRIPEEVSGITSEKATNFEAELGINTKKAWLSVNVFNIVFDKVIVYGSDPATGLGTYVNGGKIGTYGAEADFKIFFNSVNFIFNYAYYQPTEKDVEAIIVPDNPDYFLAFAKHRLNGIVNINISKKIFLNINALYYGERFGFTNYTADGRHQLKVFNPDVMVNANLQFQHIFYKMNFLIGVSNITDTYMPFIQPYDGEHAPLPGLSRSLDFKITYEF